MKAFLVGILFTLISFSQVGAQKKTEICGLRADIFSQLARRYQEYRVGTGTALNGTTIDLVLTEDGSTWTIVVTLEDGRSCLVAAGNDWAFTIAERGQKS